LHACASFKIENFNKDSHPKGAHARAEPLIGNPKGYPDHLCAAKLRILLAQPSGDDLVLLLFLPRKNNNKHGFLSGNNQGLRACIVTDGPSNKNYVFVRLRKQYAQPSCA